MSPVLAAAVMLSVRMVNIVKTTTGDWMIMHMVKKTNNIISIKGMNLLGTERAVCSAENNTKPIKLSVNVIVPK